MPECGVPFLYFCLSFLMNTMRITLIWLLIFMCVRAVAQPLARPSQTEIQSLPQWAKEMYGESPNILRVDSLYRTWYAAHTFEKNYHTQYYKIWRHHNAPWMDSRGNIRKDLKPAVGQTKSSVSYHKTQSQAWNLAGPFRVWDESGSRIASQTNVYSFAQCASMPSVLFCGTEPGEVYRSLDTGQTWSLTTASILLYNGITAIAIDPANPSRVFAGSGDVLVMSSDTGSTWSVAYSQSNLGVNEIFIHPNNGNLIILATNQGLIRSSDGGSTWTLIFSDPCWDIKLRPFSSHVLYLLKSNPGSQMCEFWTSQDTGTTFTLQTVGWYQSSDPVRYDGGARLAVTPADSLRVYAYLIGDSKANDFGYIGLYKSTDGGQTWMLPNGPVGGPYTNSHPNLAYGNPGWTYHQGFYNCALMVDDQNADRLLIGGLNLWRSDDGGSTFSSVAGYSGGPLSMHVDMQDFRPGNGGSWITTDGGIYFSNDFFTTDLQVKMDGIHGSDFWGFGHGWNDEVMVGGLYHNGTIAYHSNYNSGDFLQLGGAEPASGYVNPGENRKVYSSDIGGAILPATIGSPIQRFSISRWPNESYVACESSEMKFNPDCYQDVWIGNRHRLYRSTDGGSSYQVMHTFGSDSTAALSYIEISRAHPAVMYIVQRPASGMNGDLWKTTNAGTTWFQLPIPPGNSSVMMISLSPISSDSLYLAYPRGGNGNSVFRSTDGGNTWINWTTPTLDQQEVRSILNIGATGGGVYCATNQMVFYRDLTMPDWVADTTGLPIYLNSLYLRPFYRDSKIRLSTYGRGIWENSFQSTPVFPVAYAQVDKLSLVQNCVPDSFYFEDYSLLNHQGATWQWSFPGGSPSTSNSRNPVVYYSNPGNYPAILTVTNSLGQTDTDSLWVTVSAYQQLGYLAEGFETAFPAASWWIENPDNGGAWSVSTQVGAYGVSAQSAVFDNFGFDSRGSQDDIRVRVDLSQQPPGTSLHFDYAYAEYSSAYSDSLEVLVSTDCGQTFSSLWRKGGSDLATAPSLQNTLFIPAASQWKQDSIDLSPYSNSTDLLIAFRNIGRFGQAIYLDNINVGTLPVGNAPSSSIPMTYWFPSISNGSHPLTFMSNQEEAFYVSVQDVSGKIIHSGSYKNGEVWKGEQPATGVYFWRAQSSSGIFSGRLILNSHAR